MTDDIKSIRMENLKEEVSKDLDFNINDADKISLKIPLLKDKYSRYLYLAKGVMKNREMHLKKLYVKKHIHYTENISKRLQKSEVENYILGDKEYQDMMRKLELDKLRVEYLDSTLKSLDQMSFNIGNAIKWKIFISGN